MDSRDFLAELARSNEEFLARLTEVAGSDAPRAPDVLPLLRIALKNEFEAAELAAHWMGSAPELDVKLGLARQAGDEAKHYRLLAALCRELGDPLEDFDPREGGYSPLFLYLRDLPTSVERLAAGQFTREAIAHRRNEMFLRYLQEIGDSVTSALYRETIQPDELHHHELGRQMLLKYAVTAELQAAARAACLKTLEIAERMREVAIARTGLCQIPGC